MTRVILGSASYFLLLCSYYVLRPVRDEMGVQTGASRLQWLFTGTFIATLLVVPLFGWIVRNVPRRMLLPLTYGFFVMNLAVFFGLFTSGITRGGAASFFIWLSVFNLFVVSLFWSNVSDSFTTEESHQYYGYIAAGGSAGALSGPALTALIAEHVPTATLVAISALLLVAAAACMMALRRLTQREAAPSSRPIGGSITAGIPLTLKIPSLRGIALLIICYTSVSTVLYVEQADAVEKLYSDRGQRTAFFATIDLIINCSALLLQILATKRVVQHFGLRIALGVAPLFVLGALVVAGSWPTAVLLATAQIVHRISDFALVRPGREMIYTTVDTESRYKAKNFIDTAVYRGADAGESWLVAAIRSVGLSAIFLFAVPMAILWSITGERIGKRHDQRQPA